MSKRLVFYTLVAATAVYVAILGIGKLYAPIVSGEIELQHANGTAIIYTEDEYGVQHIKATSKRMAFFAQGYAHAQTRLWQMEKMRRLVTGRFSELFGDETLPLDKFFRSIDIKKAADDAVKTLTEEEKLNIQAYCDGVNDFIAGVGLFKDTEKQTARALPIEFILLGITEVDPWTIEDSELQLKMISLFLAYNWNLELLREVYSDLEGGAIADLAEELLVFKAEDTYTMGTTLDDEDMKKMGLLSSKPLNQRFSEKEKMPETEAAPSQFKSVYFKGRSQPGESSPSMEKMTASQSIFLQEGFRTNVGFQVASNNWVISGNHTATGRPMVCNDPHLTNGIPSFWTMQHLEFQVNGTKRILAGSSIPGMPSLLIGRTNDIAWGITASLADVTDMYKETLDEKKEHYLVDGEWRKLEITETEIKVGSRIEKIKLRATHRGPLLSAEDLKGSMPAIYHPVPIHEDGGYYSFAWTGYYPGESYFHLHDIIEQETDLKVVKQRFTDEMKYWNSGAINLVAADRKGNIAYTLLATHPIRKDAYPFVGSSVQDGTTTKHDWIGIYPMRNMPFALNPSKGYYASANNRIVPESSLFDTAGGRPTTARFLRISEMIEEGISAGKKFTPQDMMDIQSDEVDVYARGLQPHILSIAEKALARSKEFSEQEVEKIQSVVEFLKDFNGSMSRNSVSATVYAIWQQQFYLRLFNDVTVDGAVEGKRTSMEKGKRVKFWTQKKKLMLMDNFDFDDFYQRLVRTISTDSETTASKYARICRNKDRKTANHCEFNVAFAMVKAHDFLSTTFGSKTSDWRWGKVHRNSYEYLPWSETPLKPIWHRYGNAGGNHHTVSVSNYKISNIEKDKRVNGLATANYKQVILFGDSEADDTTLMTIDTGMNENLFGGHYFDMQRIHARGKLLKMDMDFDSIAKKSSVLTLTPPKSSSIGTKKDEL